MKRIVPILLCLAILLTACSNETKDQSSAMSQTSENKTSEDQISTERINAEQVSEPACTFAEMQSKVDLVTQPTVSVTTQKDVTTGIANKPTTKARPVTNATTTQPATTAAPTPTAKTQMNAVWISYLEYENGMLKGKTEQQFRGNMQKVFNNCTKIGVNTVFIHMRPFGDAVYASQLFPWSSSVTGTFGGKPVFDPLEVILQEAKKVGIEIHAWLNPFRMMKENEILTLDETSVIKQLYNNRADNDYIQLISGRWYLNPASGTAKKLVLDGIAEIVRNYDVDGIHIDDYFYPTTALNFDDYSFAQSGSGLSRSAWRQSNISKFVADIYKTIKDINGTVLFGVSPDGSVENNVNKHYADVELWCSKTGFLDYICPQVYYGFENQNKPFEKTAKEWNAMVKVSSIKLIFGLANYKIGKEDTYAGAGKREWIERDDIIPRQILFVKTLVNSNGVAFYRYNDLFNMDGSYLERTKAQTLAIETILK